MTIPRLVLLALLLSPALVRGEPDYNQALSERRADSVRQWLVGRGIGAERVAATGAGESRPLSRGTSEAEHQKNRRVEIRIRG
jgi:OmpA-OmpF porin, OOP family